MSSPDDSTRPISVAELLAKNGSIGSPPVGGRRRRRRGNDDAVSVAELTGEIPIVVTTYEIDPDEKAPAGASDVAPESADSADLAETAADGDAEVMAEPEAVAEVVDAIEPEALDEPEVGDDVAAPEEPEPEDSPSDPDSDAEQMTFDPVDDSAVLLKLAADQQPDPGVDQDVAELQSYLRASGGTLFSGETVADDVARGGSSAANEDEDAPADQRSSQAKTGAAAALGRGALVALQSILAVAFGAGLFISFDQLWRWNNIIALVLSVLVILGLVVAVRVVRKTEDIASTLIAVAVGALVTLGPLALLQSI